MISYIKCSSSSQVIQLRKP